MGQSTATATVTPVDDAIPEPKETVILTLASGTDYEIGTPNSANVDIFDNDDPIVTVSTSDTDAYESNLDPGTFTISREGDTTVPLTVNYTVGGTAASGSDYDALAGSVTIPIGQTSVAITVTPVDDTDAEPKETVVLTLTADTTYQFGSPSSSSLDIIDNDTVISVAATDPDAQEAGLDPGTFTITRNGDNTDDLAVYYTVGGTADPGSDYTRIIGQRDDLGRPIVRDRRCHAHQRQRGGIVRNGDPHANVLTDHLHIGDSNRCDCECWGQ